MSFQAGCTKLEIFVLRIQHTWRKLLNFEIWCNGAVSKIGHHSKKLKWFKNCCYISKNPMIKMLLLNWYFSLKKIEKDFDAFWQRKLTLKVELRHFLTPPHYTDSPNLITFLGMLIFRGKSFQFCTPRLKTWQPVLPW